MEGTCYNQLHDQYYSLNITDIKVFNINTFFLADLLCDHLPLTLRRHRHTILCRRLLNFGFATKRDEAEKTVTDFYEHKLVSVVFELGRHASGLEEERSNRRCCISNANKTDIVVYFSEVIWQFFSIF